VLVGGALGVGELLAVADGEGDVLVDGEIIVVVGATEDRLWLGVGLADPVREEVRDGGSRLVPGKPTPTAVAGRDAVAGDSSWLVDGAGDFVVAIIDCIGGPLLESSTATMAATPHAARPMPPIRKARRLGREPAARSSWGFSL
jgi:hypothetical protein